jgi:hypothetical protein
LRKVAISNYELDLLPTSKVGTKVFHVSLLKLAAKGTLLKRDVQLEDDDEEYEVEEVIDSQKRGRNMFYLIR